VREKMPVSKSYFDVKKGKWFVTAQDAAKWKPGPCVVWEITSDSIQVRCPLDNKCPCAHLSREELDKKNRRNGLGDYVDCTLTARCKHVLNQIKSGAWNFMKDRVNPEAPCLVELLQWLSGQPGSEIDVDLVQSFISANKTVNTASGVEPQNNATWIKAKKALVAFVGDLKIAYEKEISRLRCIVAVKAAVATWKEEVRQKQLTMSYVSAVKSVPLSSGGYDAFEDYEWCGMREEARKSPLMWI